MSFEILTALVVFSFVTSVTPGPNNLMLLASGVNFGFRRSVPHMVGIGAGFGILLLCVGYGLGQLLARSPQAFLVLKFAGGAYLVYLAARIALSREVGRGAVGARPMTLLEAVAFQWINPKGWVMAISAMAVYTDHERYVLSVLLVAAIFVAIGVPAISLWTGMGVGLRRFLDRPAILRAFNWTMAVLLVASLWPMLR